MTLDQSVAHAAAQADAQVRAADPGAFVGIRLPDDLDLTRLLGDSTAASVVASYERPDQAMTLVAVGVAATLDAPQGAGPAALRSAARRALGAAVVAEQPELRPRLLGGFRFNPNAPQLEPWAAFGGGRLTLPRLLFVREAGVTGVVLAPGVSAKSYVTGSSVSPPNRRRATTVPTSTSRTASTQTAGRRASRTSLPRFAPGSTRRRCWRRR